jgi:hypothetical protein
MLAMDDTKDTVSKFLDKIAVAKSMGDESIETSVDIIRHYNRRGLMGSEYFIYEGVKVYPVGKREEIEDLMKISVEESRHRAQK